MAKFDKEMVVWEEADAVKVRRLLSTFVRSTTTPSMAVGAWRSHYTQLEVLFVEVSGFEQFMIVIATYILKYNKAGMAMRVSLGALLSMSDGFTDMYVIMNYYDNEALVGQAHLLVIMVSLSMFCLLGLVFVTYTKKSWDVKLKEMLICLSFLRPTVDAYRISTNHEDDERDVDLLNEILVNKAIELAMESIPGCVL